MEECYCNTTHWLEAFPLPWNSYKMCSRYGPRRDYTRETFSSEVSARPKEWESGAERQKVRMEEAAVKSSGITKKRHRGRHTATGRRMKPTKKPTRGDCESRRKLVAACRKVSRCAAVAWHRRNIFRDIRTQGNCGLWEEVTAAVRQ
jgi:hypothetical protein